MKLASPSGLLPANPAGWAKEFLHSGGHFLLSNPATLPLNIRRGTPALPAPSRRAGRCGGNWPSCLYVAHVKRICFLSCTRLWLTLCVLAAIGGPVFGQGPVTITVNREIRGRQIPKDFLGLSFETASLLKDHAGVPGYLFDSTNTQLIDLFGVLGLRNIRIGGGTVDNPRVNPSRQDIDALFGFVKAAKLRVIYSLRLLNGNAVEDASIAKYIWTHYRHYVDAFAVGNEPDWPHYHDRDPHIYETSPGVPGTAFPSYFAEWKKFVAVIHDSVPDAKFGGPDTGSNYPIPGSKNTYFDGKPWTIAFADSTKGSDLIDKVYLHNYTGQAAVDNTAQEMVDKMLSPTWDANYYQELYSESCAPILKDGFNYRLTESNSFTGGVQGGSNCFATALYSLDYLYWWAEHDASGVNFHNKQWLLNDTIYRDSGGNYRVNPMAYGIKAFSIGSHGELEQLTITNPHNLDLTAYAALDGKELFITIINKEHGDGAQSARVTFRDGGRWESVDEMVLAAPGSDPFATTGITLGGAAINSDGVWHANWIHLWSGDKGDRAVMVPPTTAAIVRIRLKVNVKSPETPSNATGTRPKSKLFSLPNHSSRKNSRHIQNRNPDMAKSSKAFPQGLSFYEFLN